MAMDIPASSESFKCQYVAMPLGDGFVVGGRNQFITGSHHVVVYSTDLDSIPPDQTTVADCYEGTKSMMTHIRGVMYAATNATSKIEMPGGVGIPYKGGAVLLFQNHFLNATADVVSTHSDVYLATANAGVSQNADVLFYYDPYIDVPIGARATASMRCPIPADITLVAFGSHYHERGVGFRAYVDPPDGPRATTPFYTSKDWASPSIATNQSLQVPAGSHIRYSCDYDNTRGTREYVQGESATDNEMCMFIGLYYPAMTTSDDYCDRGDEVGTGNVSCTDTLDCFAACPPAGDTSQTNGYSACAQKCMVASCPAAAAPLATVASCIAAKCASQCGYSGGAGTSAADAGGTSDDCKSCVLANCGNEYFQCAKAPCEAE
jgi:hypothetical protein